MSGAKKTRLVIVISCVVLGGLMDSQAGAVERKPRVVVMTDIGGDPDDEQSMVRFLLYSCDFEVEGLCTGFGHGHERNTRPDLIRKAVDAYGQVVANLRRHRRDYPTRERLMSLIKDGHNGDAHQVGEGMDSEASEWIIKVLEKDDARPVWFSIWGGPRELAQVLWKLERSKSAPELAKLKRKIRVHSIADQDRTAQWVKKNHPDVWWIFSNNVFRGMYASGDGSLVSPEWLREHVLSGHGALGGVYPADAAGKKGVKEGDTPSFLYVVPNGLSDPEHPEWGNWGGRFRPSGRGSEYVDAADFRDGRRDPRQTVARWRQAYQNGFEVRMDWCVKGRNQANHEPSAVCNGDKTLAVLEIKAEPGTKVKLSAAGSSDPDGDKLRYSWWVYPEAGTYWAEPEIEGAAAVDAVVTVPEDASGRTIHVILEVVDSGKPALSAYRRVVLEVSGEPAEAPEGAEQGRRTKPVTKLGGPGDGWEFYRGININGQAVSIDGRRWEGDDAANFECKNRQVNSPQVRLWPPTDAERAKMIHSFRWDHQANMKVTAVPKGKYAVYAYVWEDNNPERFSIFVEGQEVVRDFDSGYEGDWRRLGPWMVDVSDGTIEITSRGGAANFSGIELSKRAAN